MNYKFHYERLIERAKNRIVVGYFERHHVLPKCMGGSNDKDNIVNLYPEEHYLAHQLLVKMYPFVPGLATAAVRMAKQCTGNKAYGWLRKRHAVCISKRLIGNRNALGYVRTEEEKSRISKALYGIKKSEETKKRMSAAQKGNSKALGLVRGPPSEEHRKRNGDARRGKKLPPMSEERRAEISKRMTGIKRSEETRMRMSIAQKKWRDRKKEENRGMEK